MLSIVSGYAQQVGCELQEVKFWNEVDEVMQSISRDEKSLVGSDFYVHVDEGNRVDS